MRSESGNGSGRNSTRSITEKIAVFAPMPSARAAIAISANPGLFFNRRSECRRSAAKVRMSFYTRPAPGGSRIFRLESSGSGQGGFSKLARRAAIFAAKKRTERSEALESAFETNQGHRHIRVRQQSPGAIHPAADGITMRRFSEHLREQSMEMIRRQTRLPRDRLQ